MASSTSLSFSKAIPVPQNVDPNSYDFVSLQNGNTKETFERASFQQQSGVNTLKIGAGGAIQQFSASSNAVNTVSGATQGGSGTEKVTFGTTPAAAATAATLAQQSATTNTSLYVYLGIAAAALLAIFLIMRK